VSRPRSAGRVGLATRRRVRTRRRDPEDKRARIMGAARRLFAAQGFAGTSSAAVASLAGVSEGIVFHHFGSKAGLLEAVAADYGRGLAEVMFEAAPLAGSVPSALDMLQRAFGYVRKHGALARLLGVSADPSETSAARRASRGEIVAALARGLEAWAKSGVLRPMDPQIVAELLFALVEAALMECFVRGDGSREEDYLRETVRCVEGAILPTSSEPQPRRIPS